MFDTHYKLTPAFLTWLEHRRPEAAAILAAADITTAKLTCGKMRSVLQFPGLVVPATSRAFEWPVFSEDPCLIFTGTPYEVMSSMYPANAKPPALDGSREECFVDLLLLGKLLTPPVKYEHRCVPAVVTGECRAWLREVAVDGLPESVWVDKALLRAAECIWRRNIPI